MDPRSKSHPVTAPGSSSGGTGARFPDLHERLAPPETRVEYLGGVELFAAPAKPPHATRHFDLTYVLGAHLARGYRGAVDMLTRTSEASDFAPDASVFPADPDLTTGDRQLEEIAFEIADEQSMSMPTRKARELIERGVRRVFLLLVKQSRVLEWSRNTDGWSPLPDDGVIEDHCFAEPLPVRALLDASATDEAVARALLTRGVPALSSALDARKSEGKAEGKAEGQLEGLREAVLKVLAARGLAVSETLRAKIEASTDVSQLGSWLTQAVTAKSSAELG